MSQTTPAIRIRKKIDSDTLHLPELGPFIGHIVDIMIEDQPAQISVPEGYIAGTGDWGALLAAAAALQTTYDYDAVAKQDECDLQNAKDLLK